MEDIHHLVIVANVGLIRSFNDVDLGIINICIYTHTQWYMVVLVLFQSGAYLYSIDFHLATTLVLGEGGKGGSVVTTFENLMLSLLTAIYQMCVTLRCRPLVSFICMMCAQYCTHFG